MREKADLPSTSMRLKNVERLPQNRAVSGDPWPDLSPYPRSTDDYAALYDRDLRALDSTPPQDDGLRYAARSDALRRRIARDAPGVPFALDLLRRDRAESREDGHALIAAYRSDARVAAAITNALDVETPPASRRTSIECLAAPRDPAGLPALARVLRDASADAAERESAARAVAAIFGRTPPGGDKGVAAAIEWIARREATPPPLLRAPRPRKSTPRPGQVLFGGGHAPLGWNVVSVERPPAGCVCQFLAWKQEIGRPLQASRVDGGTVVERLSRRLPFDEPCNELLEFIDGGWTARFEDGQEGGHVDGSADVIFGRLGARAAVAPHVPMGQHSDRAPHFLVCLPKPADEEKQTVRRVDCGVYDSGHWGFRTSESPRSFEEIGVYEAKFDRERFTLDELLRYLGALGLHPDDPEAYVPAVLVESQFLRRDPRLVTLEEVRGSLEWK